MLFLICFLNPRQRLELNSLVYIFHFVNKRAWPFSAVFCSDCLKHKGDVSMTCQTKYNIDLTALTICNWLICDSCGDEKWKANHVNRKRERKQQMNPPDSESSYLCLHLTDNYILFYSRTETVLTNTTVDETFPLIIEPFSFHLRKQSGPKAPKFHSYRIYNTKKNSCGELNWYILLKSLHFS